MKKFSVVQRFDASRDEVIAAFRTKDTWQTFKGLPFVGDPALEAFDAAGGADTVEVAMSYRVQMDLPALAEKFIDPKKLTFVERNELGADGRGTFKIIPDHYKKMLSSSGTTEVVALDDGGCERRINGSVDLSLGWAGMLFEGPVEEAIVNGLQSALAAQAKQVDFS